MDLVWRPKGRGWCVVMTVTPTDTCQYLRVWEVSTGRHIQTIQQYKAHKDNMVQCLLCVGHRLLMGENGYGTTPSIVMWGE